MISIGYLALKMEVRKMAKVRKLRKIHEILNNRIARFLEKGETHEWAARG